MLSYTLLIVQRQKYIQPSHLLKSNKDSKAHYAANVLYAAKADFCRFKLPPTSSFSNNSNIVLLWPFFKSTKGSIGFVRSPHAAFGPGGMRNEYVRTQRTNTR